MSYGPNGATKQNIFALKSRVGRQEEEITQLKERVAVLEGIAQANADDRDSYAERCAELEQENGRLNSRIAYLDGWKQQAETHFEPTVETS